MKTSIATPGAAGGGLELTGVNVYYGRQQVVRDVSLNLPDGGSLALMGRNGVGKTTLVRSIIKGFGVRVTGRITLQGQDLTRLRTDEIARSGVAFVPSDRRILPMSVAENLRLAWLGGDGWRERAGALFEYFPFLNDKWDQRGDTLSGGEQQALAIVRGLMRSPRFLILDEPAEGLAPMAVAHLIEGLTTVRAETHVALLIVERNQDLLRQLTSHVAVMVRGRIEHRDETATLLNDEALLESLLSVQSDKVGRG
jgi:branched-chain amino acid transport system ATP-binding protein